LPIEGLVGRIVGDFLVHFFNLAGAYILSMTVIAIALYLSTAFSFSMMQTWFQTRFTFFYALRERFADWREARAKAKATKELEQRKLQRPVVTSQLVPAKRSAVMPGVAAAMAATVASVRTGIEGEFEAS